MPRDHHAVLLVIEDRKDMSHVTPLVARLRALGCAVFAAGSLDEAANLIRAGLPKRLMLVHVPRAAISVTELQEALSARLPGWAVETQEGREDMRNSFSVQPPASVN
jgi:hypothetical protein